MSIEAMKRWLAALEDAAKCVQDNYLPDQMGHDWDSEIAEMHQAIEQAQKQEPVAWGVHDQIALEKSLVNYTSPPQRQPDHTEDNLEMVEKQEPVAWRFRSGTWFNREAHWRYINTLEGADGLRGLEPLYTSPPQRQPLTDEQIVAINDKHYNLAYRDFDADIAIARAIEAAHGITASEAEDSAKGKA